MTTSLLLLIITIHWSFALGSFLAMRTNLTILQFLMLILLIRYIILQYAV